MTELVTSVGFEVCNCEYVHRRTVNKKEGLSVPRIFVQGKFVKPSKTRDTGVNNLKHLCQDMCDDFPKCRESSESSDCNEHRTLNVGQKEDSIRELTNEKSAKNDFCCHGNQDKQEDKSIEQSDSYKVNGTVNEVTCIGQEKTETE